MNYSERIAPARGLSFGGRITLLSGMQPPEEFSTLLHEIAHEILHRGERRTLTRKVRETEAEAVAFIVCQSVGLQTGTASADYVAFHSYVVPPWDGPLSMSCLGIQDNERELYRMRIENLDWATRVIFVPDSKTEEGRRRVPMSNRVFDVLKQRCEGRREGWVFPSERAESAHLTTMAKRFREARVKAGLPEDLVLYCGRHDYGTRILKRTGNLAAVMRTMGQKDVKTAMQYQHPELEIVRAALDQDTAVEKRA
ncbi:MAG TPA: tyrosine-type recombinase/integrase [Terriglobales bacterium]